MSRHGSHLLGPKSAEYSTSSRRSKSHRNDGKINDLRNLRHLKSSQHAFGTCFFQWLARVRNSLAAYLFVTGGESKRMCSNYGHVLGEWEPHKMPKCNECGTEITITDQIRGSNLKG